MCAMAIAGGIGGITGFTIGYIDALLGGQRGWQAIETAAYAGRAGAIIGAISGPIWYTAMAATGLVQATAIILAIHEWALGFALGGVSIGLSIADGKYAQAIWRVATTITVSGFGLYGLSRIPTITPIRFAAGEAHEGLAFQSEDTVAIVARTFVEESVPVYRLAKMGTSDGPEGQFWSLNNPLTTPDYANKMGIPPQNVNSADYIIVGHLKQGSNFVTRTATGIGNNLGGGIEVVVPRNSVQIDGFFSYPQGVPYSP